MAYKIGIIGGGSMGGAIACGLVASGEFAPERVNVADLDEARLAELSQSAGVGTFAQPLEMLAEVDPEVAILAVKPQVMPSVLAQCSEALSGRLVISIAAGVPIATYEDALPGARVIRIMPNLPIQVRSGASALAVGSRATADDVARAQEIFSVLGSVGVMREDQVDVAGQSVGCSPALYALMIDCLTRAAVRRGMAAKDARAMFISSMLGTAQMLQDSGEHPRAYMERVTSPGGTTIQFLRELEPLLAEGCELGIDAALARNDELAGK